VPPLLVQVFPKASFQELYDGLKQTTQAGGPTYHRGNYTVLTNNHQAIFGGWQVCEVGKGAWHAMCWITCTLLAVAQAAEGDLWKLMGLSQKSWWHAGC